jgi:hypothetical protein
VKAARKSSNLPSKLMTLVLPGHKPRNPLVAPATQRKAGAHTPSKARARQDAREQIRQALRDEARMRRAQRRTKDTE